MVTTQESFPYNPGLPFTTGTEGEKRRNKPDRRQRQDRPEKQEKWNWANSAGKKYNLSIERDTDIPVQVLELRSGPGGCWPHWSSSRQISNCQIEPPEDKLNHHTT